MRRLGTVISKSDSEYHSSEYQRMRMMRRPCSALRSILFVSGWFLAIYAMVLVRMQSFLNGAEESLTGASKTGHVHVSLPHNTKVTRGNLVKKSFAQPSANYTVDSFDLWEGETTLPEWMKAYFRWHKETQSRLLMSMGDFDKFKEFRFMILMCHEKSTKCGGTADRLSAMPFLLRLAAKSRRLFFIYWGRPCALEEFLVPPVGGMDWRVPSRLKDKLLSHANFGATEEDLLSLVGTDLTVVTCRFQSHDHGSIYFDKAKRTSEKTFSEVTRDAWKVLFTPSPGVSRRIVSLLNEIHLRPGNYVAAHLRALYAVKDRDPELVTFWTQNAVNCSSQLGPHEPIFFAADNRAATLWAQRYGAQMGVNVLVRKGRDQAEPLHLDKATDWRNREPSEYYNAFVDLYLLSLSQCVTYGMGGYGKFASYLSYNASCAMQHHTALGVSECTLVMTSPYESAHDNMPIEASELFAPPMASHDVLMNLAAGHHNQEERALAKLQDFPIVDDKNASLDLLEASPNLPAWMKSYFRWHKQQRTMLNEKNWFQFRFLVMECLALAPHCGGTADRLRSIPFMIRLAAENKRILFVYWEKPKHLEDFLLPPRGGMDWRMPRWLVPHLQSKAYTTVQKLVSVAQNQSAIIVQTRLQANDHGSAYYNSQATRSETNSLTTFRSVYRDCWFSLFTPVPMLATRIEEELDRLELQPGEFGVAHLRALYGIEHQGRDLDLVRNWTQNALNCLSNLRPGGPFFFSSDSAHARDVAVNYGREKHTPIRARVDAPAPIHLDKVNDWKNTRPSEFFDIFVDLYIMSMGRCISYNMGGFAKWAQLISGNNFECKTRHWTYGVDQKSANKTGCIWVDGSHGANDPTGDKRQPRSRRSALFLPPVIPT